MARKYTYIDLFAGCGGLSLGLHNSERWKGIFAIEKDSNAFKTLEYNLIDNLSHFSWPSWLDVKNHDINKVINDHRDKLEELQGEVDLVAGGPPCQGFSTAGKRKETDHRNQLIDSYIKFIRLVQPKLIFFENVKGFTQKFDKNKVRGRLYSKYVMDSLSRKTLKCSGYNVYGKLIDFSKFGIPQKRTRFILVGIRKDLQTDISPRTFFEMLERNKDSFLKSKGLESTTTLGDAISDLLQSHGRVNCPDSKGFFSGVYGDAVSNYQILLRGDESADIPDSHRFANHRPKTKVTFERILNNSKKNRTISQTLKDDLGIKKHTIIPLGQDSPAATMTTLPDDYLHYSEPRIFTVREYARIQSFNDWYEFKGKYTTGGKQRINEVPRYSQIGNAIPPLFGEYSGEIISKLLE